MTSLRIGTRANPPLATDISTMHAATKTKTNPINRAPKQNWLFEDHTDWCQFQTDFRKPTLKKLQSLLDAPGFSSTALLKRSDLDQLFWVLQDAHRAHQSITGLKRLYAKGAQQWTQVDLHLCTAIKRVFDARSERDRLDF